MLAQISTGTQPERDRIGRSFPRLLGGIRSRLSTPVIVDLAIGTLAVLLIASPLLFSRDGFAPDFTNDIWMSNYQQHSIATQLHPTLFMHSQQVGVFNPIFAFYGATLFSLTGALGLVLGGSTILAFEVVTLAAIAASYGGLFWLARQLGARGPMAHAPAVVFVSSAYYVTTLYGRGAWVEFMTFSALPLVIAASLRVVRGRWRVGPVVCLVGASTVFSGGHNITLLLGSTLALGALACYWLLSGRSRELPWQRMLAAAGLIALGVGLNSWTLLPDLAYAHNTLVSTIFIPWSYTKAFNAAGMIFDPLRAVPAGSETPALYVQVPVLALVWGLAVLPLVWRQRRLRAGVATALIVLGGLLMVIMSSSVYALLPSIYKQMQFAYRLQTYVVLACAGLVLLGVLALTRRAERNRATRADRRLKLGLGLVVAFGLALSVWQLWVPSTHIYEGYYSSFTNRAEVFDGPPTVLPESWNAGNNYGDRSLPIIAASTSLTFDPTQARKSDRVTVSGSFPPGVDTVATNIAGGPYLVDVTGGARVAGRTEAGYLVLARTTSGSQPVRVEVKPRLGVPVVLGRIATATAAFLLLALAAAAAVRGLRRRRVATHPTP